MAPLEALEKAEALAGASKLDASEQKKKNNKKKEAEDKAEAMAQALFAEEDAKPRRRRQHRRHPKPASAAFGLGSARQDRSAVLGGCASAAIILVAERALGMCSRAKQACVSQHNLL